MRFLTLSEVLLLHDRTLAVSGGSAGLRDLARVEAAVAAPKATFDGAELYPTIVEKAAALCFSIVQGHAFVDGNKRVGHAAMEVFLVLNGFEIAASVDEQEQLVLGIASSKMSRDELVAWLRAHIETFPKPA
jgi:death-on-curing protein